MSFKMLKIVQIILISLFTGCRYLARAVLVPFTFKAPKLNIGALDRLRKNSPAAIPQIIYIINSLSLLNTGDLDETIQKIEAIIGKDCLDGRLLVQYSLNLLYSHEVSFK